MRLARAAVTDGRLGPCSDAAISPLPQILPPFRPLTARLARVARLRLDVMPRPLASSRSRYPRIRRQRRRPPVSAIETLGPANAKG